ncbi:MAG: class I SAM-dependent methyltransferase [Planctomycetes bacterium]|nr:class I SAM-dependent methyltransferase [Planctomycetota bacterium]
MDLRRLSAVAHDGMTIWNPLANADAERIVTWAAHEAGGHVLDIGCGKGDLLLRTLDRSQGSGIGVDPWPHAIELARRAAARRAEGAVRWIEAPFDVKSFEPASFDVVMCIGATHACGGFAGTLDAARLLLKPGGRAIIGDCHWLRDPIPDYLTVLDTTKEAVSTLDALRDLSEAGGFVVKGVCDATRNHRDSYENAWLANVEKHFGSRHYEESGPEYIAHARRWHEAYVNWGRTTLGFAVLMLTRDDQP